MSETSMMEPTWAKVEIFGHTVHYGRIAEIEQFGTKMLRIDVPKGGGSDEFDTKFYGGAAIFGILPMTEEAVRKWADYYRPTPVRPLELMPPGEEDEPEIVDE